LASSGNSTVIQFANEVLNVGTNLLHLLCLRCYARFL
jgi:hypothetical protein